MQSKTNSFQGFKHKLLPILSILISSMSFGQSAMGEWTLHVPAREASAVVTNGTYVYASFDNGLLEYEISSGDKSIMTITNSLSDVSVSTLGYEPETKTVVIGYKNGNLDLLQENTIYNIPAIKLAEVQGVKTIQSIKEHDGKVYVATGFGVVVVDPKKQEVRETYYPTATNEVIYDIEFSNDTILLLTENRVLYANVNSPGLSNFSQWNLDTRVPIHADGYYRGLETINEDLLLHTKNPLYGKDTIYLVHSTGLQPISVLGFDIELYSISNHDNALAINVAGGIFVMNSDYSDVTYSRNFYAEGEFPNVNNSIRYGGSIYIADKLAGLTRIKPDGSYEKARFNGPPKNQFYSMDWEDGKLLVNSGGLSGSHVTYNKGGVYLLENQEWRLYDAGEMPVWQDTANIWDFVSTSINPKNSDQFAVSTYSNAPVTLMNKDKSESVVFTPYNSPLEFTSLGNGMSYVSDLQFDEFGNLWMVNGYSDNTLKVRKEDETWVSFALGGSAKSIFSGRMAIDYNNNVWFTGDGDGLFGFDYNETLDNPNDDKLQQFKKGEGVGNLPSNAVRAIAVDFDNEIWVGTDAGFAIIYNSENVFDAAAGDFDAQRIKLDFEGNVEYLLGSTVINDIEVDGGNRKWMGTEGAGIFLMSPDGLTILENYTVENSDLISDNILDLEIDHNTGEVYVITDAGLVSLRTDASYEDPEYENVVVFPNPALPDFEGDITIQGIRYNSDIKITDIGGNLVYRTTSNGGTAIWNGRNLDGTKVASGVYLIWTAANEGKGKKVGKVVVINE